VPLAFQAAQEKKVFLEADVAMYCRDFNYGVSRSVGSAGSHNGTRCGVRNSFERVGVGLMIRKVRACVEIENGRCEINHMFLL
jgi:hypothetical protein